MAKKFKQDKTGRPVLYAVIIGLLISITLSLILTGLMSVLLLNERITETMTTPVILFVTALSAFMGTIVAANSAKGKYAFISGATAIAFGFVLIAVGILFFESGFKNIWTGILAIVIGSVLACAISLHQGGGKRKGRRMPR